MRPETKLQFMKSRIKHFKNTIAILLLTASFATAHAQDETAVIKEAIEAKQFVFNVQIVSPASGTMRQVGGEGYRVRLSGDSLFSALPYFGRAYSAPLNSDGGINFTSTKFDYTVKATKKGSWDIVIHPKGVNNLREFLLTVNESGNASLEALSNNRQPISFNGMVTALQ